MEELPIPDGDDISRLLIRPDAFSDDDLNMISEESFIEFRSEWDYSDSAVWRRFAKTAQEVHSLGIVIARKKQERRTNRGAAAEYAGFMTARAGQIRLIQAPDVRLDVKHKPDEGDSHAEIFCRRKDESQKISLGIRTNLKLLLHKLMSCRHVSYEG